MSLHVDDISDMFYAKMSGRDITVRQARRIGISKIIADNSTIRNLHIDTVNSYKKIDMLFEGLKHNTTLEHLHIHSCPNIGKLPFPNCNVKSLIMGVITMKDCMALLSENTTLKSLTLFKFYVEDDKMLLFRFCRFLQNLKVDKLHFGTISQSVPMSIYNDIFMNNNVVDLYLDLPYNDISPSEFTTIIDTLCRNTKLESLRFSNSLDPLTYLYFKKAIEKNQSLINFGTGYDKQTREIQHILDRNKNFRWEPTHKRITDVVIAMFPLRINNDSIPPYVMLWIIDWICPDNSYSTHFKKITLILNLYTSIRKIPRYTIV